MKHACPDESVISCLFSASQYLNTKLEIKTSNYFSSIALKKAFFLQVLVARYISVKQTKILCVMLSEDIFFNMKSFKSMRIKMSYLFVEKFTPADLIKNLTLWFIFE